MESEGKCRLPLSNGFTVDYQQVALSSECGTEREHPQNNPLHCKTGQGTEKNESPGALAGATGANALRTELCAEDYKMRAEAATALCEAISDCHPDDAVQLMTAALADLCPHRTPGQYLLTPEEDAAWWAGLEEPEHLVATVEAALARLGDIALHLRHRKRLIVALFQSLPVVDRRAFLAKVDPSANFMRGSVQ